MLPVVSLVEVVHCHIDGFMVLHAPYAYVRWTVLVDSAFGDDKVWVEWPCSQGRTEADPRRRLLVSLLLLAVHRLLLRTTGSVDLTT